MDDEVKLQTELDLLPTCICFFHALAWILIWFICTSPAAATNLQWWKWNSHGCIRKGQKPKINRSAFELVSPLRLAGFRKVTWVVEMNLNRVLYLLLYYLKNFEDDAWLIIKKKLKTPLIQHTTNSLLQTKWRNKVPSRFNVYKYPSWGCLQGSSCCNEEFAYYIFQFCSKEETAELLLFAIERIKTAFYQVATVPQSALLACH